MGAKYSSQAIIGYNANPPSDDGLRAASNEVLWAKHKDKLADPCKVLAEAIDSALRVHLDESVLDIATNTTTTTAQHKRTLNITNGSTISLASATTLPVGWLVRIRNSHSAAITIDLALGSDTLDGAAGGSTTIDPGKFKWFLRNVAGDGFYSLQNNIYGLARPENSVLKTADESVVSNNTPLTNNDDHLFFTAEANGIYVLRYFLYVTDVTGGIQFRILPPAGGEYYASGIQTEGGVTEPLSTNGNIFHDDAGGQSHTLGNFSPGPALFELSGLLVMAGTGGQVNLDWVQSSAGAGATTMKAGSYLNYVKVA